MTQLFRDFRAETIYFIFTDRFCNGDPSNDFGAVPEATDPTRTDWVKYWGGDLQGVIDKLDYLKTIGVSTIWISPVFDQTDGILIDGDKRVSSYHGYWTKDFRRIDEHLLPPTERGASFESRNTVFDRLLAQAHDRQMHVLMDVMCSHTSAGAPGAPKGELYSDGVFLTSFDDDRLGWYNRNGPIRDWNNLEEVQKCELQGLADLNEEVWAYRHYITETMRGWLRRGADGFRIDAVKHMSLPFWQEFTATMLHDRPDAILFGEWAGITPEDKAGVHFANTSGMSVFDFGFQYAVRDVFCHGAHFSRFAELVRQDHVYDDATELVTFLDNHDMPRLLSLGMPKQHLPLAVTLLMTSRGVPCLFYGTEQALHDDTEGGGDPYNRPMMTTWDLNAPVCRILPLLADLRRRSQAIQRGFTREVLVESDVFAFARGYGDSAVLVIINRGAARVLDLIDVLLPTGTYADLLKSVTNPIEVHHGRIERLGLPAHAAVVLEAPGASNQLTRARAAVRLNGYASNYGERVVVTGNATELGQWDLARATPLHYVNANLWTGDLHFEENAGEEVLYRYAIVGADGKPRYEDRLPRARVVHEHGVLAWRDRWER